MRPEGGCSSLTATPPAAGPFLVAAVGGLGEAFISPL